MNFPLQYQYNLQQVGEERREEDIDWISVLLYPFWNHWQLMVLAIWLALSSAIHWQITSFLFLNCIFFPMRKQLFTKISKQSNQSRQVIKVTNQTAENWKKPLRCNFCNICPHDFSTGSIKLCNNLNPVFGSLNFANLKQISNSDNWTSCYAFWSEITLVNSN